MSELNRLKKALGEEKLNEISKDTMSSYMMKASDKNVKDAVDLVKKGKKMSNTEYADADQKIKKRDKSIRKVISKLNKSVQESEFPKNVFLKDYLKVKEYDNSADHSKDSEKYKSDYISKSENPKFGPNHEDTIKSKALWKWHTAQKHYHEGKPNSQSWYSSNMEDFEKLRRSHALLADKREKGISKLNKPVQESKDAREYDYEGEMAKNDLHIITMHAERIAELLDDNTNMPEWVQSKLTLAKDYMQTISDYLCAEMREDIDDIDESQIGWMLKADPKLKAKLDAAKKKRAERKQLASEFPKVKNEDIDEACWKGYVQLGMKEKDGKSVPNCIPTSKVPRKAKVKSEDVNESSDYMRRRQREEDIISGKKPARKRIPKGNDYFQRRKKQDEKV